MSATFQLRSLGPQTPPDEDGVTVYRFVIDFLDVPVKHNEWTVDVPAHTFDDARKRALVELEKIMPEVRQRLDRWEEE